MKDIFRPENFEVDAALEELEWQEQRQQMALWRELHRQKVPMLRKPWQMFCWWLAATALLIALSYLVLWSVRLPWEMP